MAHDSRVGSESGSQAQPYMQDPSSPPMHLHVHVHVHVA